MPDARIDTPEVTLWTGGKIHSGWKSVAVTLNLDHLAGEFDLTVSEGWLEGGRLVSNKIPSGAACAVKIGGETVITGYVDVTSPRYGAEDHQIGVRGRDRTGDLVDCSAEVKEFLNQKMEAVAVALCAPFGVTVRTQADTGAPFARVAINAGDSVSEIIERMCRQRGVLAWSDGQGALVIGRPDVGTPVATLVRGDAAGNILSAEAQDDRSNRFSDVTTLLTREGADDMMADDISHSRGAARDPGVTRHRPLILVPETSGGEGMDMNRRAAFEVRTRAAKGRKATVKVRGWSHAGGLFLPGQTVAIEDEWLGVSGSMLIGNVTFTCGDDSGTVASLTLYPPGAFDVFAQPKEEW